MAQTVKSAPSVDAAPVTEALAAGPGRPKDMEKRAAILVAAVKLFVARGYDATSMDAVATEAGVSKLTVYNHFSDKENLFLAAVNEVGQAYLPHDVFAVRPGAGIRERLTQIARAFVMLIESPESEAAHRMMLADPRLSARIGPAFYEAGPRRVLDDMCEFLRRAVAAGELEIAEPARAAEHFFAMLKSTALNHMVWQCACHVIGDDREAHVASAVDLFWRAFRPQAV
jgi:TetR/AcrR family transcriptional repressor of mexJK operon